MLSSGRIAGMDKLGYFVKIAVVLLVLSVVSLIIVDPLTTEFYLSLAAALAALTVIIVGAVVLRKRK